VPALVVPYAVGCLCRHVERTHSCGSLRI
jgi:hypothetical protein